jgi:L-2-hydroxycarboxylate dehydrogenase (NAD+)
MKLAVAAATSLAEGILSRAGVPADDRRLVLEHLLDAERSGHATHGLAQMPWIVAALQERGVSSEAIDTVQVGAAAVAVKGNRRLGLVVAQHATDLAARLASEAGVGVVGASDYTGTTGALSYYTRRLVAQDLVGIVVCNSWRHVAPTGSRLAILGTNPISIGIPSAGAAIVSDLATSAWAYGAVSLAMKEHRPLPPGVVIDARGEPSTDPHDAEAGALLPFGGHKGYALGLAIELLAGPFVGAKAGRDAVPGTEGLLIIAMRADLFAPLSAFKGQVDALVQEIKQAPLAPGVDEVVIPGERSGRRRQAQADAPEIEIADAVLRELEALAAGG